MIVADVALALAIFATPALDVDQVTVCPVIVFPLPSTTVAVSVVVLPARTVAAAEESCMAATVGAAGADGGVEGAAGGVVDDFDGVDGVEGVDGVVGGVAGGADGGVAGGVLGGVDGGAGGVTAFVVSAWTVMEAAAVSLLAVAYSVVDPLLCRCRTPDADMVAIVVSFAAHDTAGGFETAFPFASVTPATTLIESPTSPETLDGVRVTTIAGDAATEDVATEFAGLVIEEP